MGNCNKKNRVKFSVFLSRPITYATLLSAGFGAGHCQASPKLIIVRRSKSVN